MAGLCQRITAKLRRILRISMAPEEKSHRLITIGDLADAAGHMMVVPFGERIATSLADQAFDLLGELVAHRHHDHHDSELQQAINDLANKVGAVTARLQQSQTRLAEAINQNKEN